MINETKKDRKSSDAHIKAVNKYSKLHYTTISCRLKIDDVSQITNYAQQNNISVSKLCKVCIDYCIAHGVRFDDSSDI